MPYTAGPNASPNLLCFQSWLAGLESWGFDRIMSAFDDTLVQQILPASLEIPAKNKTEYTAYYKAVMPRFTSFTVTVHDLIETGDRIIIHASSRGTSTLGTPYANEYVVYFEFRVSASPDTLGERKICSMKEFVDSSYSKTWFAAERTKVAEHAASVAGK